MAEIDRNLFKNETIQGVATGDGITLTKDAAFKVGHGLATYLQRFHQMNKIVVGRDNRATSYDLQQAVVSGLRRAGTHVVDIGLISSPLMYWHAINPEPVAGLMVSGGSAAPHINGFRMTLGRNSLFGSDLKIVRSIIDEKNYTYGRGEYEANQSAYSQYIHDLRERLPITRPLTVVADMTSGTAALFLPRLMSFWKHTFIGINQKPVSNNLRAFGAVDLKTLSQMVVDREADVGLAFDADASTLMVVADNGEIIASDRILALLAHAQLQGKAGAAIVADVLASQTVADTVERAIGKLILTGSGEAVLRKAVIDSQALVGGNLSGHFVYHDDYLGFGDAYYATGKLLQLLASSDKKLSELDNALPRYHSSPEYRLECPYKDQERVISGVMVAMVNKGKIEDMEGIRVQFEHGWGLLRASDTSPELQVRFEADAADYIILYRKWFAEALAQFPMVERLPTE